MKCRAETLVVLLLTALASALIFSQLGHYALWDDEAFTALNAKGILRTGDTSALPDDHNLFAFRNGAELIHLRLRDIPPLQGYLAAPFLAALGTENAFAARLPFALCAMGSFLFLMWWLLRAKVSLPMIALAGLGLALNVSFLLYGRQCRYYAPAILFSLVIVYCHLSSESDWKTLLLQVVASVLLIALNYLNYAALVACLIADWFVFQRGDKKPGWRRTAWLIAPQIVALVCIGSVWNPLARNVDAADTGSWLANKLTLLFWNIRDMNRAEFCLLPLLLAALCFGFGKPKRLLLLRGMLAFVVYLLAITAASPQPVHSAPSANIRYLVPLIPLCVVLEAQTMLLIAGKRTWIAIGLAVLGFGTNLLNGGPMLWCGLRSTIICYAEELTHPRVDPYSVTARWINENVSERESIVVFTDYMAYPLMFQAPKATYGWQLARVNSDPQFSGLPEIDFYGLTPPDYFIAFGPGLQPLRAQLSRFHNVHYEQAAILDCYWQELTRPELFDRVFKPVNAYNRDTEAIYIFKKHVGKTASR